MFHILVAEDNDAYRKLLRIHLVRAGYEVFEAGNGSQALEILANETIHLLMAAGTGHITAERILSAAYTAFLSGKNIYKTKPHG